MYTTWVLGFPSGNEQGSYLTIDLGGSNLRVCWITLNGRDPESSKHDINLAQHKYEIKDDMKTGEASELWKFIAVSLQKFIQDHDLNGKAQEPLRLGFTFSYPAIQDYIDQGVLQTWTKGFDIKNVEGKDVASQLREAMKRLELPVELIAVINDTTGAMIASAYNDPDTVIGAIFGTGCNAAYMDKISNIPKLSNNEQTQSLDPETPMAINCEYGAFDNSRTVLPVTKYDSTIDEDSPRPGEQAFEKLSAGLYLGEIYRLILLDLNSNKILLKNHNLKDNKKFSEPYCIDTALLSSLEDDTSSSLSESARALEEKFDIVLSEEELLLSQLIAHLIAIRGARLCACGIAAICRHQNITKGHVAADGSVANKHPRFKRRWARALGEILDWEENDWSKDEDDQNVGPIMLTSAEDGSGIGAAVIAAMTIERWEKGQRAGILGRNEK